MPDLRSACCFHFLLSSAQADFTVISMATRATDVSLPYFSLFLCFLLSFVICCFFIFISISEFFFSRYMFAALYFRWLRFLSFLLHLDYSFQAFHIFVKMQLPEEFSFV